jgi:branched-chain amino acid transport system permease protein
MIVLAIAVAVALAWAMERFVFRRLRGVNPETTLVATFAVAIALEAVWVIAFGVRGKPVSALPGLNHLAVHGSVTIRWITFVELAVGAAMLIGILAFLNRTSIGLQMRAAAADFRAARLIGVRADRVISMAFVISGVLAGAVAILVTVSEPLVTPTLGLEITILALVGIVVGGMNRLLTATAGGFAIGFANSLLGAILPSSQRVFLPSAVFLLVIIVLLIRPGGLFASSRHSAVDRV